MWSDATRAAIRAVNTYLLVQSTDEISHHSPEDELVAQRKPADIRGIMNSLVNSGIRPGFDQRNS